MAVREPAPVHGGTTRPGDLAAVHAMRGWAFLVVAPWRRYRRADDPLVRVHAAAAFNFQATYAPLGVIALVALLLAFPENSGWRVLGFLGISVLSLAIFHVADRAATRVGRGDEPGYPPSIPFLRP